MTSAGAVNLLRTLRPASTPRSWDAAATTLPIVLVLVAFVLGRLVVDRPALAVVGLGAVVAAFLVAVRPVMVAVTAVTFLVVSKRIPGDAISYSDAVLALASGLALLPLARSVELRRLSAGLRALSVYLIALVPSLMLNPAARANLEWLHRAVLVGGAFLVAAWLVRERKVVPAMRGLLLVTAGLAVVAVVVSVRSGFEPAYPLGFHKNFIGPFFGMLSVCLVGAPQLFGIGPRARWVAVALLTLGLLASQSRGAMLALALGVLVVALRRDGMSRPGAAWGTRALALAVAVVVGYTAFASLSTQLADTEAAQTNSIGVRYRVEERTREVWATSPVVGVGLRYFNAGVWGADAQASNNAVNNELAESGVVGAAGWLVMHGTLLFLLIRRRGPIAGAALGVLAGRVLHGQLDIYWSAGVASLCMVVVGLALASPEPGRAREAVP